MPLFDIPTRATTKDNDLAIARKSKESKTVATVKRSGILSTLTDAKEIVEEKLGHLKDDYIVIRDLNELLAYMQECSKNKVISIDTETTGLDPISDKLVGLCLYTPNCQACYVPINHVSYITGERVDNQLTEQDVKYAFDTLATDTKVIMFNAQFDIRVLRNQCNVFLKCYWDCYIGARCLNENEQVNTLKKLHQKYVLEDKEDEFTFGELFKGITFDKVPIDTAYIYAAHDAIITYELYKFQEPYLSLEQEREDLKRVAWVFHNIEMPVVDVVVNMEDTGVCLDDTYTKELSVKYNSLLEQKLDAINNEMSNYDELINAYKTTHSNAKIDTPINVASPTQLAILLYDILNIAPVDEKNARGTGKDILMKIDHPIAKMILDYRTISKLVTTYIDKLPECVNEKTHRIHCKFNQYGADTGRFSSDKPNLQNIPSHNADIRKMFKATDGYVMMSSDFSQQEPKALAALCRQQGDSQMYDVFMQGKDLYSEIASKAFHKTYEECREFNADGTTNKEGKDRRSRAKSILLGVLYGRGTASIAEQLNCSVEEAQNIKDSVFRAFPAIKRFEEDSINMSKERGFVTTVCGRKRRLPSMQLPDYEIVWSQDHVSSTNALDFVTGNTTQDEVPYAIQEKWLSKIYSSKYKRGVFEQANKEGLYVIDNTRDKDVTKVVNARIQGSAADLTKVAMIELNNNERLKELGFRMLIPVHDEVIAECPEENAKECKELLAQVMSQAAEHILDMPIKCDVTCSYCWYGEEIEL